MTYPFKNSPISNAKGARTRQKKVSNTKVLPKIKNAPAALQKLSITNGDNWVELMLPLITVSEANGGPKKTFVRDGKTHYKGEHWTDKNTRHKKQKGLVFLTLKRFTKILTLPCLITLTRYAPTKLDRFDNLPMSLKWILDATCAVITGDYRPGRADDNELIDVKYSQVVSQEYGVKIHIAPQD